jgi:Flp pilus assembly protein CpaB
MEHILSSRLLTTRSGTMVLGIVAAVLAAVILFAYLAQYRSSVASANNPMAVLVAKRVIQKGTSGEVVGAEQLFTATTVPQAQLVEGAIADPSLLRGRIATADIYPGQQLTAADFAVAPVNAVGTRLSRSQRAISLPIDAARGLIGHIQTGDRVDVFAGFNTYGGRPVLKMIFSNALVLSAPPLVAGGIGGSGNANIVLRADHQQAADLAFASDNGRLWLVLRPAAKTPATPPSLVTIETLLFGVKPVTAYRQVLRYVGGQR